MRYSLKVELRDGGYTVKIVGVDASLTGTGVAVFEDGSLRTERIESKQTGPKRLIEIRDRVKEIVRATGLVAIEGYAFAAANQAHQIGELGGVLRVMLTEETAKVNGPMKWIEVAPSQVKKFATGKGNAKKEEMAVGIFKRWGREFKNNDEADAFVLALIGQAYLTDVTGLTAFQREVIEELRNPRAKKKKARKAS